MQLLWVLLDIILGFVLAGMVVPLVLVGLPEPVRGPGVLALVSVACIVLVGVLRRLFVGTPGLGTKR